MLIVEVMSDLISTRRGTSSQGKEFELRTQDADVICGRYRYPIKLRINSGSSGFSLGRYQLLDEAFGTDEYDNLSIRRDGLTEKHLKPIPPAGKPQV